MLKRVDDCYWIGSYRGTRYGVQKVGENWHVYGATGPLKERVLATVKAKEAERERRIERGRTAFLEQHKKQEKRYP